MNPEPGAPGAAVAAPFPTALQAPGTAESPFLDLLAVVDLPAGAMRRVSSGDLDVLLAHTDDGIVATEDRCPHMSAPLSMGELDGCVVACPLHEGRFDLRTGDPAQMPTTGGLDPDGVIHPVWTPGGRPDRPDVPGKKAEARRLTRVRRFRYFPVRVEDGRILVALPVGGGPVSRPGDSEPVGGPGGGEPAESRAASSQLAFPDSIE